IVFILPDGGEFIQTYADLKKQAERMLGGLRSRGLQPGELVIIYAVDRDFVAAFWACILGGFVPVPMTPDLKRPQEAKAKLKYAWTALKQPLILASADLIESGLNIETSESLQIATAEDLSTSEPDTQWHPSQPDDLAYLVMSSGTTGTPKIVQMTHYVVTTRYVRGYSRKISADGKNILLNWMPFSHSTGLQVVRPQWDRVIYIPTEAVLQDPLLWLDTIERYQVTNITLPNFALGAIADRLLEINQGSETHPGWDLSKLRRIAVSTEAIVPRTARQFLELLMPYGLNPQTLHPNYGMSEVGAMTTANNWSALNIQAGDRFVEVGSPDLGCSIRIVDEQGQPMQAGEVGRIEAYSPVMTPGYYLDPERTASTLTTDGWFKTGDLGFLKNGQLTVTGRSKELIIINGHNYHSTEIESVAEGVDALERGYTAACATRLQGNNTDELGLFFHVKRNKADDLSLILKQLRKTLNQELGINPTYLIPVEKSAIPKTTSGKIQRLALKKRFEAGEFEDILKQVDGLVNQSQQDTYVAPRTPTEELLTTLWPPLLKLEKVGIYDNFFELGGHSLLAAQLMSRIRQTTQLELPLHSLFAHPTLAELADVIDQTIAQPGAALPIPKRLDSTPAPLSFAQQRLWLVQQLEPESRAYHLTKTLRLQGALDIEALQKTFTTLVARHGALRTRFVQTAGDDLTDEHLPVQQVDPPGSFHLPFVDLSLVEPPDNALQTLLAEETGKRFDLSTDLMIRATLVRLKSDQHVLLFTMHHIASDGWSMGIFKHELSVLYQAYAQGQANPLPELPIQYADFAQWQRQWLSGQVLDTQLNYWKQQLAGAPPVLALPTDHPRPAQPAHRGSHVAFTLPPALTDGLKALSQKQGATLYMTLLAALNTLLYRYSQQDDIVVGSPIANRDRPELEGLIGFFVNTLTLRSDLSGNPSFQALLERVRQVTLGAYAHQNIPFEELVATLKPERTASHSPWFQVMFVFQNQPRRSLDLSGLTIEPFERKRKQGNVMFDLTLIMKESDQGLSGKLVFKTDLFEKSTISRMVGHLQTLLAGVVANPQQPIAELPLLTIRERQQRLAARRHPTRPDCPAQICIHQLFEAQVEKTPEAIALIHQDTQLTYQALNHRANGLANHLRSLGVGPETLVGLSIERSVDMIVGLLGILKAGGAYVPLDPTYPPARLAMMVADAQPQVIVTMQALTGALPGQDIPVVCLDSDWEPPTQSVPGSSDNRVQPNHLAYVIYTSGSTGKPKGVMIEHRSLVNFTTAAIAEYGITECDLILQFASINFDAAAEEIFPALCTGATLVLRTDEMLSSPTHFIQQCETLGLTVLDLPTAYWHQLTAELPTTDCPVPANLRVVIIGGEAAIPEQLHNWHTWLNTPSPFPLPPSPPPLLINTYGPTESTV
ncbi:MAG: condensation domain-containing protein, partial [Cyanobacteria bacterium P01_F01_bin.4]